MSGPEALQSANCQRQGGVTWTADVLQCRYATIRPPAIGPNHRTNQTRDGDKTHGTDELGFGERTHQGKPAHRNHHGSAAALQDATCDMR